MAHQVEQMLYVGKAPWHGLGVALNNPPSVAEAIRLAGLDWEVLLADLQLTETGAAVSHKATVRATDRKVLGVVGPRYRPVQNADAFAWFEPFLESGEASIHTAGSLAEGRRVWILAKINRAPAVITRGDEVQKFILLSNSHDGTLAVRVGFTPVRVVCANTLAMSHRSAASQLVRIRHTASAKQTLEDVREVMNAADAAFEATAEQYRRLAQVPVTGMDLAKYVRRVLDLPEDGKQALPARSQNILDGIIARHGDQSALVAELLAGERQAQEAERRLGANLLDGIVANFEGGRGSELAVSRGSYWSAYNAVTEYLSHERGRNADTRLNALWFGEGAQLNQHALAVATEMAA